jgi:excisionase family DNA binding protein
MPETLSVPQADTLLVGKAEAARLTGISTRSIGRLVSCGKFPSPVRLGGRVLWNRRALERWVASGCVPDENLAAGGSQS